MDLRVASSGTRQVDIVATGEAGQSFVAAPGRPDGTEHAYEVTAHRTLCGQPLAELHTWPGLVWPGSVDTSVCPACATLASD